MSLIINIASPKLETIRQRGEVFEDRYLETVADIVRNVKSKGDEALFEYTRKFDKFDVNNQNIKVSQKEYDEAIKNVPENTIEAIHKARENILSFHKLQMEKTWLIEKDGAILGQKITPLERVGVYAPGGKAAYFSSAMMNILPAVAAGVGEIIMSTPAVSGVLNQTLIAAAKICGVSDIYKIGGAQAIAAMAYGTNNVPKVDKITGPGNIYVALAKKLVFGNVDIDMIAGPSEVLIIADNSANPEFIAADMLAQCEHDELACALTLVWDKPLAESIEKAVLRQVENLPRKEIALKSLENYSAIILVDNIDEAFNISNRVAPEHLELCINSPFENMTKVKNAGAIFLGCNTPEALGDYFAGPNHVLPTGGTAKFFSPLGTYDFFKRSSIISCDEKYLQTSGKMVINMARTENLEAHARSVETRLK